MRKSVKLLCALLVLVMLFTPLCGCINNKKGPETTTVNPDEPTVLDIVKGGVSEFKIIRSDNASTDSQVVTSAKKIRDKIESLTGVSLPLGNDMIKNEDHTPESYQILVGSTNYDESAAVFADIGYGDYALKVVGNKIVIAAYSDSCISEATSRFCEYLALAAEGTKEISLNSSEIEVKRTTNKALSAMPIYDGGKYYTYYNPGDDCSEIIIKNTDMKDFDEYLAKLSESGFTCYTTNSITENKFATYTNDKYTLNVGYYNYEKSARLIVQSLADPIGLAADNDAETAVDVQPQITSLGIQIVSYNSETKQNESWNNGLCVLIRLKDGRFIIIDGGFNTTGTASTLSSLIKKQAATYATGKNIKIAAWIITHAHGDHSGCITKNRDYFDDFTFENVIINSIAETERLKTEWGAGGEGGGNVNVVSTAKEFGAKLVIAHVGQIFYFSNVQIEVLYTIESLGPTLLAAFNSTSLIMKMTFDKGTDHETTYMSTGDATGEGFDICNKMYRSYMKSDILQIAHHGFTPWINNGATETAYGYISPKALLWPVGEPAWSDVSGRSYNKAAIEEVIKNNGNDKDVYIAGALGDTVVFPIPYTVGSAVVTRK